MKHIVTQEDIDNNKFGPEVEVGHEIDIPSEDEQVADAEKNGTLEEVETE